jgi:hypothetical protein
MTLLVSAPAAGQRGPSIFLELDPDVPGSATEDRIQVLAVNWGLEVPVGRDTSVSGETVAHPVVVTKMVDRATPRLFQAMARGERFNRETSGSGAPTPSVGASSSISHWIWTMW